jgi:hypothetical protein
MLSLIKGDCMRIPVLLVCSCLVVACGDQDFSPDIRAVQVDEKCQMFEKLSVKGTWTPFGTMVCEGDAGERGERGPQGDQGIQGVAGEKGDTGAKGERGEKGDRGEQGIQGVAGSNGLNGRDGTNGTDGVSVQGPQGLPGESIVGPQGLPGVDGKDGQSCSVAEKGNVAVLTCGDSSVELAIASSFKVCTIGGGKVPEVVFTLNGGETWVGSYSTSTNGDNTRLADLSNIEGLSTTDQSGTKIEGTVKKVCNELMYGKDD